MIGSAGRGDRQGDVLWCSSMQKARGVCGSSSGLELPRPELPFGTDNILPLTSSQSLNLSNLTLWFVFLFKVGVIVLVAAVCLRCAGISGLNLVKTCQAEVGHKCSKTAAVTGIPPRKSSCNTSQAQVCLGQGISELRLCKAEQYSNIGSF